MIEYILKKLVDSGMSVAKDILAKRVKEKNDELLSKKIKAAQKRQLSSEEIKKIALDEREEIKYKIWIDKEEGYDSLSKHISLVEDWSGQVGFNDLRGKKPVRNIYIELDTYLTPLRRHFDIVEREHKKPLSNAIFDTSSHIVILGQPGAGKTTSMKKLCSSMLDRQEVHDNYERIPLLVRLRDIARISNDKEPLFDYLSSLIAFEFEVRNTSTVRIAELVYPALLSLLEEIGVVIVLDGFDEIVDNRLKNTVLEEFRILCRGLTKSKVVLTCRTGEFNYHIDNSETFEIAPLAENQIKDFAYKWIENDVQASQLLSEVSASPFSDTLIKPLSLAHLCAIYERIGKIPERPKTVYRKVVNLLLEEWDEQRSVRRQSRYAQFESDRKSEFLSHLAYYFTTSTKRTTFGTEQFADAYREIRGNFGLSEDQEDLVVSEIESHTGLFVQSGYQQYEFAHKSIQEYLAAEYIVRLPVLPKYTSILETLPNELAIAVSISSNPSQYFSELIINRLSRVDLQNSFYDVFVNRLVLEKPDFYVYQDLVLALHVLLSNWVCEGKITSRHLEVRRVTNFHESRVTFECTVIPVDRISTV